MRGQSLFDLWVVLRHIRLGLSDLEGGRWRHFGLSLLACLLALLIDDDAEQAVIAQFSAWASVGVGVSELASRLKAAGIKPRQGQRWTQHTIQNLRLRLRLSQIQRRAVNASAHTDEDLKDRMQDLRARDSPRCPCANGFSHCGSNLGFYWLGDPS